jgi:hypothetical protein
MLPTMYGPSPAASPPKTIASPSPVSPGRDHRLLGRFSVRILVATERAATPERTKAAWRRALYTYRRCSTTWADCQDASRALCTSRLETTMCSSLPFVKALTKGWRPKTLKFVGNALHLAEITEQLEIRKENTKAVFRQALATVRRLALARAEFLSGRGHPRSQRNSTLRKSGPAG